jgi:hypothetical protein
MKNTVGERSCSGHALWGSENGDPSFMLVLVLALAQAGRWGGKFD